MGSFCFLLLFGGQCDPLWLLEVEWNVTSQTLIFHCFVFFFNYVEGIYQLRKCDDKQVFRSEKTDNTMSSMCWKGHFWGRFAFGFSCDKKKIMLLDIKQQCCSNRSVSSEDEQKIIIFFTSFGKSLTKTNIFRPCSRLPLGGNPPSDC